MSTAVDVVVREYVPADQPKLAQLAAAIRATGRPSVSYSIRESEGLDLLFLVAEAHGHLLGSVLALPGPGAMAMVLLPLSVHPRLKPPSAVENLLLHAVELGLKVRQQKLAYSLLSDDRTDDAATLQRNGYRRITRLVFLRHDLKALPVPEKSELELVPYAAAKEEFLATLLASYAGSLDCPEMDGHRTPEEILAGHASSGSSGTSRWHLLRRFGQAVGVQLWAERPEEEALELVYLGFLPAARGQGLGRRLLRQQLPDIATGPFSSVTISYDERNIPAEKVYLPLGFKEYNRQVIYLLDLNRDLNGRAAASPVS